MNVPLSLTYKVKYNHHIIKQKTRRRWQEVVISPPAIGDITNHGAFFLMMRKYRQAATALEYRAFGRLWKYGIIIAKLRNSGFDILNSVRAVQGSNLYRVGLRKNIMCHQTGNTTMKILVVDDDELFLAGFDKVLQTEAAEVKTVATGKSALQEIEASQYYLCFLDLFLPDINGAEVLTQIKKTSPRTKVIVMTAGVVNKNMQEKIEKDAYMFITKPLDLLQIRMLTRRILEESTEHPAVEQ